MTPLPKRTLRTRITTAMLLVSILPLVLYMGTVYIQQMRTAVQLAKARLITVQTMKKKAVSGWLRGAMAELRQLSHNPILTDDTYRTSPFLERAASDSRFFDRLRLVTTDQPEPAPVSGLRWTVSPDPRPILTLRQPLIGTPGQLLEGDVDVTRTLGREVSDTIFFGGGGTVWLADRQGRVLDAGPGTGNRFPYPSGTVRSMAAAGRTALVQDVDRSGRPVFASVVPLPDLPLSMICIQNREAALAPMEPFGPMALGIGLLALLAVAGTGLSLSRSITRPIRELTDLLHRKLAGDETNGLTQIPVDTREMAMLVRAYLNMDRTIETRLNAETALANLSGDLVSLRELSQWTARAATIAATHCGADLAAVYQRQEDGRWKPVATVGVDLATLPDYDADTGEGELGKLLRSGNDLLDIQLPIRGKTLAGTVTPSRILAIPLRHEDTIAGFLALGFYREPEDWVGRMLQAAAGPFSAALSGILYGEHIRDMATELEQQNIELEQQNTELETQARELEQQAAELETQNLELDRQKHELETADRYKSEFISTMSHELRTPLNAIISLSRLLLEQPDIEPDSRRNYLAVIERNGQQLLRLINDILDLSRIDAGHLTLTPSTVRVGALLHSTADMCRPLAGEKDIELTVEVPDDLPDITSDAGRLQQILINLTGNAVKFTETGSVTLRAEADDTHVRIHVRDTGIGIQPDQLALIFEPFRQVDGSTRRQYQGTGLGLAICRKLADALGCTLTAESTPGTGSIFTLSIPIRPPAALAENPQARPDPSASRSRCADPAPVDDPESGHLLVVEDDEAARIQITDVLTRAGYRVTVAVSGEEALAAVRETVPDGIVLDLMMPGMDGFDLLERIRNRPETFHLPVLILTAKDLTPGELDRLSANHIQQLIRKGDVNRRELLSKVRFMLNREPHATPQDPDAPGTGSAESRERPVALLIEDNPDNAAVIQALLAPYLTVLTAPNGTAGLEFLHSRHVDIVLLDIMMPGMDGFEVVRQIRAGRRGETLPVIAVSAMAMAGERDMILASGCNDHVPKPVDRRQLLNAIARWVPLPGMKP